MIGRKQQLILAFPYSKYDALICDGAIRTGKTSLMFWAYVKWAMDNFDGRRFIILGKTVGSAYRNVVEPFMMMSGAKKRYRMKYNRGGSRLVVSRGGKTNFFDVFGGKDESSYMLIQGFTAAGCFVDEVALCARSAVEQALARCSVDGSRYWFNCNPDSPNHWFYREWILKAEEHNALHLHFLLRDNPSLSEHIVRRYESQYTGVFHDRYIKGLWVQAEGLVYPRWNSAIEDTYTGEFTEECISMDYGTLNPTAALKWRRDPKGKWHAVAEYYYSGREEGRSKTDREFAQDLIAFADGMDAVKDEDGNVVLQNKTEVIVDPSAASFIAELRQTGRFKVLPADNDVLDGIRETMTCLEDGTVRIGRDCKRTMDEFAGYVWDDKSEEDRPIKESDHAMDAMRYLVHTRRIWKPKVDYKSPLERHR